MVSIDIEILGYNKLESPVYLMPGDNVACVVRHAQDGSTIHVFKEEIPVTYMCKEHTKIVAAMVFKSGNSLGGMFIEEGDDRFNDAIRDIPESRLE